jgi:glycosyltransferase involved in cell wall biosynthesis
LAGIDIDTEIYSFSLKRLVDELSLSAAVRFLGGRDDSEVKALYQHSSLYLCMSEHEGFCLPIIEAIYHSLPVIAYSSSAVRETIGGGGVLVNSKDHALIAELIEKILSDASIKAILNNNAEERVFYFSEDNFEERLEAILL